MARGAAEVGYEHDLAYPWAACVRGSWRKWPSSRRPDVVAAHLVNVRVDAARGTVHATRLMVLRSTRLPGWLRRLLGVDAGFFVEESVLDPARGELRLEGRNLLFEAAFDLRETCVYRRTADGGCRLEQRASLDVRSLPRAVSAAIGRFALGHYAGNVDVGRRVLDDAVSALPPDGKE